MGREAKRNEENRKIARKIRDEAHRAFLQSFAILTNSLAATLIVTEHTGQFKDGVPEGQTRQFTISHATPEVGLGHMAQGAELLHDAFKRTESDLKERKEKALEEQAAELPTPEGMAEGPGVPDTPGEGDER